MFVRLNVILALTLIAVACSSTAPKQSAGIQNVNGGYLAVAPWYRAESGTLYATDGTDTWYLVNPQRDAGFVGGADVGQVEEWRRVGEGLHRYCRTPATFRDQTLKPVFIAY